MLQIGNRLMILLFLSYVQFQVIYIVKNIKLIIMMQVAFAEEQQDI